MALLGLAFKLLFSLLLWPLAGCLAWSLGRQLWELPWGQGMLPWFAGGFVLYLLVQVFFWRPLFLYVMGHELTHALAAVLQGGQADDLRVSTKGGMVKVNRSNFIVNLAPYFFPIYTAAACAIWAVAADRFKPALSGLVGLTLAFHFALTFYSLKQHQSDITEVGWLFAIPLIVSLNVVISALVLRLMAGEAFPLHLFFSDSASALGRSAAWVRGRL
ncbi:MAG TPA: M50 family metallopeptidase [bacterium]|nr:M50 family metallopeptidase [bacterium]